MIKIKDILRCQIFIFYPSLIWMKLTKWSWNKWRDKRLLVHLHVNVIFTQQNLKMNKIQQVSIQIIFWPDQET